MKTDFQIGSPVLIPFLLRFAEPLKHSAPQRMRYDEARQIAQVYLNDKWVDSPDALDQSTHSTRVTKVQAETTDEE